MRGNAIGHAFKNARSLSLAGALNGGLHRLKHGNDIVAVKLDNRNVVALPHAGKVAVGVDIPRAGADGKAVVLADEDHRQLPEDRQIDRFIVHAAGGRRLAVIANRNLLRVAELCGKRQAGRDGEAVAEHAVASRNAELRRERVHHAARSVVRPAGLEEKIAHDGVERNALRQQRTDAAVGIIHKIIFSQTDRAADRQRFLPDGRVVMAEIHALVHKFALAELIQNTAGEHRFVRF